MFVTFEGIDKSGKTTQSRMLASSLRDDAIWTREPGGTELGNKLRTLVMEQKEIDYMTELLLFMANRYDHYQKVILPSIEKNIHVICDRFIDSTVSYQGHGYGIPISQILKIYSAMYYPSPPPYPHLTFLIDIDEDVYLQRCKNSDVDITKYEEKDINFVRSIRKGFLDIANQHPNRIILINGMLSAKMIHNIVLSEFHAKLSAL